MKFEQKLNLSRHRLTGYLFQLNFKKKFLVKTELKSGHNWHWNRIIPGILINSVRTNEIRHLRNQNSLSRSHLNRPSFNLRHETAKNVTSSSQDFGS